MVREPPVDSLRVLDLSPTKILIILIVGVLLLGPKRLPQVARQLGSGWRRLRELHQQIDSEVRKSIPDLPSSHDLVRMARSPVALLNQLAEMPTDPPTVNGDVDGVGAAASAGTAGGADGAGVVDVGALSETRRRMRPAGAPDLPPATTLGHGALAPLDDPSLN